MGFEVAEWRALALGWAAATVAAFYFAPVTWPVPAVAIIVAVTVRMLWRA